MKRATFVQLGLGTTIFACAGAGAPSPSAPLGDTTPPEDASVRLTHATARRSSPRVERMLATMSRVRELSAIRPVPSVTLGRQALLAEVRGHLRRDVPPSAVRAEGLVQKLLGFFPTHEDYEAVTYALLEGQLAGYYEPANGTMYLADDLDEVNASSTLAHELVHALQDQHWDLRARARFVAGQDDKDSALSALAEGDATSAMEDETMARESRGTTALDIPDADLARVLRENVEASDASRAPHALRMSLVAPYVDGVMFVNALRRRGGWASVDDAWEHPPVTTEQILHPDKWRVHEPAITLPTPPPPAREFTLVEANTYGEQGLRLSFEEWMPEVAAALAASGWGGDRAALYVRDDREYALLWYVRFDEPTSDDAGAFAARAFNAVSLSLPRLGRVETMEAAATCVERAGNGVMAVRRAGRDVLLAFGAAREDAEGWRASMSCTDVHLWTDAALLADRAGR